MDCDTIRSGMPWDHDESVIMVNNNNDEAKDIIVTRLSLSVSCL